MMEVLAGPASTGLDPNGGGDVGTQGPMGLLLIVLLLIAAALLVKSMGRHLKRLPRSFDPEDQIQVPDDAAELFEPQPRPGEDLLEQLRRAPRAIEAPRADDGRPGTPPSHR